MRNLKKVLTLVLTLAMLLSVMVVGAGAAFSDQDSIGNKEAVDVCSTLNIINGYGDGTFRPNGNVTRAEMCKMICVALNGGKEPTFGSNSAATFNDVANDNWAKPYIEYCVSEGIVGGVGGGRFNPDGNITGTQTAKMLLCILGYDASIAGYVGNDSWEMKINVDASAKHLYDGITGIDASAPLTRDQAAQMIWNALQANEVEYVNTFVPGPDGSLISQATVRDKVVGSNNDYITLLRDKYNAYIDVGTLTKIKGDVLEIVWNDNDKIESDHYDKDSQATAPRFSKLAVDYSSLLGEKVKVVTKDGKTNNVLGVFATDDNTVYNTVVNAVDIDTNKQKIKVNGTDYSVDDNKIDVYVNYADGKTSIETGVAAVSYLQFENANKVITGTLTRNDRSPDAVKFIDSDGNGKIDTAIITQVLIEEVGYVSSDKVIVNTKSYMTADNNVASDVAEGDYAAVTYNCFGDCNDIVKAQYLSSVALNATKTNQYQIDGTWYAEKAPSAKMNNVKPGDTVNAWVYNGVVVYAKRASGENAAPSNVCVVLARGANIESDRAKILKLSGNSTELVTIDTQPDTNVYEAPGDLVYGAAYEYSVRDGKYSFKALTPNDASIYDDYTALNNGGKGIKLTGAPAIDTDPSTGSVGHISTGGTGTIDSLGGTTIADSAKIVLIKNFNNTPDYKIVTGKQLKTLKHDNTADNVLTNGGIAAFTSKIDGVKRVTYAVVAVNGIKTAFELSDNYGYVIAPAASDVGNGYMQYTIWDGTKELIVREESNVKRPVGSIIGYSTTTPVEGQEYSIIKDVSVPALTVGAGDVGDDESTITLDEDINWNITSKTKILYLDTKETQGVEKHPLRDTSTDGAGKKIVNVAIVPDGNTKDLSLLVVDVTNELTLKGMKLPSNASAENINNALLAGDAELSNSTGITINDNVAIPEGSTLTLNGGATGVNLNSKSITVDGDLVVDSGFVNATGTINVAETGTVTLNAAMTSTTVPTITGTGKVVVNTNGAVSGNVTFGNIRQDQFNATGAANPTPVQVDEGLKLSGPAKVTNFSGSLTLDQLAKRAYSTTVTPYQLNLLGASGALDDNSKAKLSGKLTLEDGQIVDCIFVDEKTEIVIGGQGTGSVDGNLDTTDDLYLSVTIGNRVKSVTYTLTPEDSSSVSNGGITLKWTFNF